MVIVTRLTDVVDVLVTVQVLVPPVMVMVVVVNALIGLTPTVPLDMQ